ncbi:hypothetical protein C5167_044968 [Papaver somniferum]|uniref:Uncharacterized protein n=1 Tax=Papaver somniferum TaxID=3469 RepID=A0A4Y7LBX1_PAPSO|nr:hypothetical protein C5167_044968 [Papaver somniferum]
MSVYLFEGYGGGAAGLKENKPIHIPN